MEEMRESRSMQAQLNESLRVVLDEVERLQHQVE